jgi:hypothetical protein
MVTSSHFRSALLALPLLLACASGPSARPPGAPLALVGADGAATTLDALREGKDATVLVFWSAGCPCVRRYQARVDALLDAYPPERVRVVGVASNAGESFAESLAAARERGVRLPLYRDEGGYVAAAFGARTTPTVAVLDAAGKLRYLGWLDNERLPGERDREPWLDRALGGVLGGSGDFPAKMPVYGCTITRSLFEKPSGGACCSLKG